MTTVISNYYGSLVDTMNYMKSLNLKDQPVGNFAYCCDSILVDVKRLEIDISLKPEYLGYIISIFDNTSDSGFHLWATQKYKEVMEFVKKPLLCDEDGMHTDDIITNGSLVHEYLREYSNIVDSKWWESTDIKNIFKDGYLLLMASTVEI